MKNSKGELQMNKENEKAYKLFLLLENELEREIKKEGQCYEFKIYVNTLLNELRRKYKGLIEE
jgi:hypothetical protein